MEALTILVIGALCIACFFVGAKVGQKVSKGEEVELPSLDPMKAIREHQEHKKIKEEVSARKVFHTAAVLYGVSDHHKENGHGF